jgi:hypothetical protein
MNDRTTQIMNAAFDYANSNLTNTTELFAERLIELVVKECGEIAFCNAHVSGGDLIQLFKEHFDIADD